MELNVVIQNKDGEEIQKKVIEVREGITVLVKISAKVTPELLASIPEQIEDGLNAGCLTIPNWIELTFVDFKE